LRRLIVLTALFAAAAPGAPLAQSAVNAAGLRYLSWPGKPATAEAAVRRAPEASPRVEPSAADAVPLTRLPTPAPEAAAPRYGLTPASAFYNPQPQPSPQPASQPEPQPYAAAAPVPPEPIPAPSPDAAPAPADDPMAPRRDAPIFRLQPQAASTAAPAATPPRADAPAPSFQTAAAPAGQSARYYSVHRQAGHEPDAIRTPQPVYLDALPVEMTQTPSSTDLAEPQAPPTLMRAADGSLRALPQTEADALP